MKKLVSLFVLTLCSAVAAKAALAGQLLPRAGAIELPRTSGLQDLGAAPAAVHIDLTFVMSYRHPGELAGLIDAQSDPRSPIFRHFLTPQQFDANYAPAAADYDATVRALRGHGFEITRLHADRSLIQAAAPAAVVNAVFSTAIHRVSAHNAANQYAAIGSATLPLDLQKTVASVVGLNNLHAIRPQRLRPATATVRTQAAVPASVLVGPDQGYSAPAVAIAYDYPVEHGFDGRGVKVADIVGSDAYQFDVTTYLKAFGVKQTGPSVKVVPVDGGCGGSCYGEAGNFDAEQVLGTAPGVALTVYEPGGGVGIINALERAIADNMDVIFTSGEGSCELNDPPYDKAIYNVAQHGTALGVTFEAVSFHGNIGCFSRNTSTIDTPSDNPLFTAVGGSDLLTDSAGKYRSETANGGSGGGVSSIFGLPAYQADVPGVLKAGRNTPDLVSPTTINARSASYFFTWKLGCTPQTYVCGWVGGIYSGAFINNGPVVGLIAEIDQMRGGRSGLLNAQIYATWLKRGYRTEKGTQVFRDITAGCDFPGNPPPFYCARSGYDNLTGLGSFDGWNLAQALR